MTDSDERSQIQNIFFSHKTLLRSNVLSWVTKVNEKLSVFCVLSVIRPESLRSRLESDLRLSHYELRNNLRSLMAPAIKLPEAFQLVYNDGLTKRTSEKSRTKRVGGRREVTAS